MIHLLTILLAICPFLCPDCPPGGHAILANSPPLSPPCLVQEQTLAIIKPDAIAHTDAIIAAYKAAGFTVASRTLTLTSDQAAAFYAVHKDRPFYPSLITYMTSGPITVLTLTAPNAVSANRTLIGPTNPANADATTLRARFGTDIQHNALHGSDSPESATQELAFFQNL